MPRYTRRAYQVGEWWLDQRAQSAWYRCRFNPKTRQTERVSLRTADFEAAKQRLDAWFLATHRPQSAPGEDVTLARALADYYQDHGQHIRSAEQARIHSDLWLAFWQDASLADLTVRRQQEFHQWLAERGFSKSYIARIVTTGRAAINHVWKNGELAAPVYVVPVAAPKHGVEPLGKPLTIEECAALFDAICSPHMQRFCLLLLGTLGRPGALLELHTRQLDFEHRLIQLNPAQREQTKKYRPTLKMPEFLYRGLRDCPPGNVGQWDGATLQQREKRLPGHPEARWAGSKSDAVFLPPYADALAAPPLGAGLGGGRATGASGAGGIDHGNLCVVRPGVSQPGRACDR